MLFFHVRHADVGFDISRLFLFNLRYYWGRYSGPIDEPCKKRDYVRGGNMNVIIEVLIVAPLILLGGIWLLVRVVRHAWSSNGRL